MYLRAVTSIGVLRPPPLHDLVRFERANEALTAAALRDGYYGNGGLFNYNLARAIARALLSGGLTLTAALEACRRIRSEIGREANEEVIRLLCQTYIGHLYLCHKWPRRKVPFRQDMSVSFDARFYLVADGRPIVFFIQPRRAQGPSFAEFGCMAGIVKRVLFKDDFDGADLEIFDGSVPYGATARAARRYRLKDLIVPSDEEVDARIQKFVKAFDILRESGFKPPARPARKTPPATHPDFWDEAPE